jgi:hypothetical protein
MTSAERLLRLYPRAWRERYGEEFLATVGDSALHAQQVIDIVSGAIDAWLSADVRTATAAGRIAPGGEGLVMLKSLMICEQTKLRITRRDSLWGAAVMIGGALIFSLAGIALRRDGWLVTGEILKSLALFGSLALSMPFWLIKGQPWKAQAVIVGISLAFLVAAGYLASLI